MNKSLDKITIHNLKSCGASLAPTSSAAPKATDQYKVSPTYRISSHQLKSNSQNHILPSPNRKKVIKRCMNRPRSESGTVQLHPSAYIHADEQEKQKRKRRWKMLTAPPPPPERVKDTDDQLIPFARQKLHVMLFDQEPSRSAHRSG
ncbi:hypothetical protein GJ744_008605 [Endocarpon pusillum]|uniref:Uncharacterized protein n=1 Tax=Endocarpon pusillum TaxID=364733 RepID=A0A8H7AKX6_9EURO|nr:hypothetical protein GJ744_008605 [Endocarpon pusillum]